MSLFNTWWEMKSRWSDYKQINSDAVTYNIVYHLCLDAWREAVSKVGSCGECSLRDENNFCRGVMCHGEYVGEEPNRFCSDFLRRRKTEDKEVSLQINMLDK